MLMRNSGIEVRYARWAYGFVIFCVLLSDSSLCFGQHESDSPRRAIIENDGVSGMWFRRDVALEMLADLQELPIRRREIRLLEETLELRDDQVARLREMVSLERQATASALEAVTAAERRATEAESSRDAWWRHPALWVAVGIVTAIVLEVVAILVLANASP